MSWDERFKKRIKNFFVRKETQVGEAAPATDEEDHNCKAVQYRLEATRRTTRATLWGRLTSCCGLIGSARSNAGMAVGINANQKLALYLHWMFRVNFLFLFAVMCIMFFALVILFAGFIAMAGQIDPECVRIGGEVFDNEGTAFADAFALSWTTFSTVGYGSTAPALSNQNDSPTNCFFINFICSLESLLGVLYSGFCGAILFGKVLRIQSHAQVIFSDPIVIRYGPGVSDSDEFENKTGEEEYDGEKPKNPCPVLEFRIINRLFNEVGGEIMDATLNVVANIDANDADPSLLDMGRSTYGESSNGTGGETYSESGSYNDTSQSAESFGNGSLHRFLDPLMSLTRKGNHTTVDEDPSARLVSKHIFSKIMIEASDHPFFKRVWLARHVLDETSPILKPRVRRQIRKNGGAWPSRLGSYTAIRDSLQFNQILVSLNGVSNVSASDVYAQKIYDFVDINIGYQFVNILYRDSDGTLGVDTDLINDVREQNGGGGEPLIIED